MKKKKDYSRFYLCMVILLSVILVATNVHNTINTYEHLKKDMVFINETTDFILYEAEIINYCANISNMSNDELLMKFTQHKANEIIKDAFNNGDGLSYEPLDECFEIHENGTLLEINCEALEGES